MAFVYSTYETPGNYTEVVPVGMSEVLITASGGGGHNGNFEPDAPDRVGGKAGYVAKTLTVSPGASYPLTVGDIAGTSTVSGPGVSLFANGGGDATYDGAGHSSDGSDGGASGGDLNVTGGGNGPEDDGYVQFRYTVPDPPPSNLNLGTAAGNKVVSEVWVGTAGGTKQASEMWIGTPAGNKKVFG